MAMSNILNTNKYIRINADVVKIDIFISLDFGIA